MAVALSVGSVWQCSSPSAQHGGRHADVCVLAAMAQQVVHQGQRHHRLGDGRGADAHAGVVAPLGDHLHGVAVEVDAAPRGGEAGGGLEGQMGDDGLAAGDAAQHAAGVVGEKPLRGHLVTVLAAPLGHAGEAVADLTPFTALMLISPWASSASRRSKTGSPRPGGTPSATTVIFAPTESWSRRSWSM